MKVFTTRQIKEIDAYTIAHEPVASIDLMERAALACTNWLVDRFDRVTNFIILAGPGNNGGDGWAIARLLAERGYKNVSISPLAVSSEISPDASFNRQRIIHQQKVKVAPIEMVEQFPAIHHNDIVIDALYGSGLTRPLGGLAAELVNYVNYTGCKIISIDIPSGLMGEDNSSNTEGSIIKADQTLTFQFPKLSFFFPENEVYTGSWTILDIGLHRGYIDTMPTPYNYIEKNDISGYIKPRKQFSHKGTYGHALLIAGSYGMMGAAVLAARACMRSGAGLTSVHVPKKGYEIIQISVPEAVVSMDPSDECFSKVPDMDTYDAVAAGPGISTRNSAGEALKSLLIHQAKPMVLDADALNLLGQHKEWLGYLPANSILTPHPKEFERIAGTFTDGHDRLLKQIEFAVKHNVNVVFKGANSTLVNSDGTCYFNSTGNPGMATGGSGDVLTGMLVSLLAQGLKPSDAALAGIYLHGLAGDIAMRKKGQQALIASDIIDAIGDAFLETEIR
jgi:ADP-dependent NAD(P)H-hydrate dehydratase / NAD(P)H-hydrate epimerase